MNVRPLFLSLVALICIAITADGAIWPRRTAVGGAAPTWISSDVVKGNSNAGSCTLNKPGGLQDDDYLIVTAAVNGSMEPYTCPTDFVLIHETTSGGGATSGAVCHHYIADASAAPATYVFAWTTNQENICSISVIRGVTATEGDAIDASTEVGEASAAKPTCPSVDPTVSDTLVLCFYGMDRAELVTEDTGYPAGTHSWDGGFNAENTTHNSSGLAQFEHGADTATVDDPWDASNFGSSRDVIEIVWAMEP